MQRIYLTSAWALAIAVVLVFGTILSLPQYTSAQAPGGSVAICPPCGTPDTPPCPPCQTQGCTGICQPPGGPQACKAIQCTQGDGSVMKAAQGFLDQLKKMMQGGGGGGGQPQTGSQFGQERDEEDQLGSTTQNILDRIRGTGTDTAADADGESGGSTFDDIFGSAFGDSGTSSAATSSVRFNDTTGARTTVQQVTDATTTASTTDTAAQVEQQGETTLPRGVGLQGDILEDDGSITVTGSGVDSETNTGIGAFFGRLFSGITGNSEGDTQSTQPTQQVTLLGRLCSSRPWDTSFITSIFSASFFDDICVRRGYTPGQGDGAQEITSITEGSADGAQLRCPKTTGAGEPVEIRWLCAGGALQSSGVGFDTGGWPSGRETVAPTETTTYEVQCSQGGSASCTIAVANPDVEIVAHPQRVPLNTRSRIYWVGDNVAECTITGPGLSETGVRGAATTGSILDTTTFEATCTTEGGEVVTDTTSIEVGI